MDNGMDNMLEMYLFETNTLLEQLDEILLDAENNDSFSVDQINEIFRIMHTVKGSAAMMQFNSIMTVAHRIEDMFFVIREKGEIEEQYSKTLFNLMFKASDFLKSQIALVEDGNTELDSCDAIVLEIETLLAQFKGEAPPEAPAAAEQPAASASEDASENDVIHIFFDQSAGMESLRAIMLVKNINEVCESDVHTIPETLEANTETTQFIIENGLKVIANSPVDLTSALEVVTQDINVETYEIIEAKQHAAEVKEAKEEAEKAKEEANTPVEAESAPVEKAPEPAKAATKKEAEPKKEDKHNKNNLINVNLSKLDMLMALVGELVITQSMVTSSSDLKGLKLDNFTKSARQLRQLTTELQDIVMSVRMVPVSGVFQKMTRIVRDMSQKLNKNVELVSIGADTEIDKTIVDSIQDPIMHIVRNSMDHGIETDPKERLALGKSEKAKITLKAQHTGSEVIITIADDGRGMKPEKILASAKEKGLLTKPESEYTKNEILQLILLPGFSTKEVVTEFSGRGVGMDVVKKNIEKVGGQVYISSEEGEGTVTTFKIPLTLAIIDGMECRVADYQFTIPIANIKQSFKATKKDIIHDVERGEMVQRGDEFITLVRLNKLYNIDGGLEEIEKGIVMWVEFAGTSFCLLVDELIGQLQVVVKPLPLYFGSYNLRDFGITGCAILGDGNISIILDVPSIFNFATGNLDIKQSSHKDSSGEDEDTDIVIETQIVNDSAMVKLLTYNVCDKVFAIDTDFVKEIINVFSITHFPILPNYIKGVINLRGQIIPILDMRLKLNYEAGVDTNSMKSCIIITEVNGTTLGLLVDEVFLVTDVPKEHIAPPPSNNKHDSITGIVEIEEMVHLIFDLTTLVKVM